VLRTSLSYSSSSSSSKGLRVDKACLFPTPEGEPLARSVSVRVDRFVAVPSHRIRSPDGGPRVRPRSCGLSRASSATTVRVLNRPIEDEDDDEYEDDWEGSKHRPLQVYPDVRRAFDTIDRAGPNVVVLPLEAPAGNGFNLEAFHRLIVKSDARAVIIIL
jgi:hypothetical protein